MRDGILEILSDAEKIAKTAKRHGHSLAGSGFYASKFSELHAKATLAFKKLSLQLRKFDDKNIKDALDDIKANLDAFFNTKSTSKERGEATKRINFCFQTVISPAITTAPRHSPTDDLFPLELVRETRGYIERIAEQACGSYDQGWYDAAAVMVRRLLEILIIETFESHKLTTKIKKPDGNFFFLQDLVTATLNESIWTIGRNVKKALPNLKDIGNQSAHGRRYIARKTDLDDVKRDLRLTIEELVNLSKLRK
ncbi:MAG: DUF4145 domain-containing protein [Fischerella sp.]|nr:DUF4145 domain-containing protein [Fischerella sp.]